MTTSDGTMLSINAVTEHEQHAPETKRLKGKMSSWELLCSVLAFAAPVTSVSSLIPFVIQGGGVGAPALILAATALMLMFSIGFVAMSEHVYKPGAFYAYVAHAWGVNIGQGTAFVAIFAYFTLGFCTIALIGPVFSSFLSDIFGIAGTPWYIGSAIAFVTSGILSYLRIDLSAKVLTIVMLVEIAVVLAFNLIVPISQGATNISLAPLSPTHLFDGSFTTAFLFSIIIFIGFESTAVYRDEVHNAKKTIPFVTYAAVLFIGIFYAFSAWMTIAAYGTEEVMTAASKDASSLFLNAMSTYMGKTSVDITRGVLILSAIACLLSLHNALARYIYTLSQNGAIHRKFSQAHPKHMSPYIASLTCTIGWAIATTIFIKADPSVLYAQVGGVGTYAMLLLMSLTSGAVLYFFIKRKAFSFKTTVCPLLALIGIAGFTLITTVNFHVLTSGEPGSGIWLQLMILGMFAYGYLSALFNNRKGHVARDIAV
ncbi:APC family permease [Pseudomonas sp. NKUCC02_KPG]|uniref:APC family permease n=1 Tax=Pseudomonas sp. NKUCC02_KPG TaxID=2842124 RepID=UPI001C5B7229|nr:APC family permease [Pseudomonas sp. NKUCC02_KPG]MBW3504520.1 APC family permease [Pseudomonas sp. NKUCC02_KPG]